MEVAESWGGFCENEAISKQQGIQLGSWANNEKTKKHLLQTDVQKYRSLSQLCWLQISEVTATCKVKSWNRRGRFVSLQYWGVAKLSKVRHLQMCHEALTEYLVWKCYSMRYVIRKSRRKRRKSGEGWEPTLSLYNHSFSHS